MKTAGDPHLVVEFEGGERITQRMRDHSAIEATWLKTCDDYSIRGGRRLRIGRACAHLFVGEPLDAKTPIEWIGYRVAPELVFCADDGDIEVAK